MNKVEEKDKLQQLVDAIEHPDRYTDKQLQDLLADEQTREYYRLMSDAESAYADTHELDDAKVDEEWQKFSHKHVHTQSIWRKIAAIFIGVILISGIAYAAIHIFNSSPDNGDETSPLQESHMQKPIPQESNLADTAFVFKDAELEQILSELADHYQLRTEFRNEEIRHTRLYIKWDKTEDVQSMVDRLNQFEKVNIKLVNDLMIAE